jgi:integrase
VDRILIVAAAYTGMRWGELTGLTRTHTHLEDGLLRIDPSTGSLHEVHGRLWLGPPKTPDSARTVTLPPFLTLLIGQVLDDHHAHPPSAP